MNMNMLSLERHSSFLRDAGKNLKSHQKPPAVRVLVSIPDDHVDRELFFKNESFPFNT